MPRYGRNYSHLNTSIQGEGARCSGHIMGLLWVPCPCAFGFCSLHWSLLVFFILQGFCTKMCLLCPSYPPCTGRNHLPRDEQVLGPAQPLRSPAWVNPSFRALVRGTSRCSCPTSLRAEGCVWCPCCGVWCPCMSYRETVALAACLPHRFHCSLMEGPLPGSVSSADRGGAEQMRGRGLCRRILVGAALSGTGSSPGFAPG